MSSTCLRLSINLLLTKLNNLSESVLTTYCQNFGKVVRCFIKNSTQSRTKEPYSLIKFAEVSSVTSILSSRNHIINGTHVVMRGYHHETNNSGSIQSLPSLMSLNQQNQNPSNNNPTPYDQIMQENHLLKYEMTALQQSLAEAQIYSTTAYETFQALREKFEAEQALTNKLRSEYTDMVESYEARLKQFPTSSSVKIIDKNRIKEEPIDCDSQKSILANHLLERQVMKDHLEQAQIDLGKCQTENAILHAKLLSREQQSDGRFKELHNQYIRMKKQYEHMSSCIKDFHSKLYPRKRLKTELKDEVINRSDGANGDMSNDSCDDVVEIIMQVDPVTS